jgi:hypothetical protein
VVDDGIILPGADNLRVGIALVIYDFVALHLPRVPDHEPDLLGIVIRHDVRPPAKSLLVQEILFKL